MASHYPQPETNLLIHQRYDMVQQSENRGCCQAIAELKPIKPSARVEIDRGDAIAIELQDERIWAV